MDNESKTIWELIAEIEAQAKQLEREAREMCLQSDLALTQLSGFPIRLFSQVETEQEKNLSEALGMTIKVKKHE